MIIKITHKEIDYYLIWSTIVDAPTTYGMTLAEFKRFYKTQYGLIAFRDFDKDIESVQKRGHNGGGAYFSESLIELLSNNHAGKRGGNLSYDQILKQYVLADWRKKDDEQNIHDAIREFIEDAGHTVNSCRVHLSNGVFMIEVAGTLEDTFKPPHE